MKKRWIISAIFILLLCLIVVKNGFSATVYTPMQQDLDCGGWNIGGLIQLDVDDVRTAKTPYVDVRPYGSLSNALYNISTWGIPVTLLIPDCQTVTADKTVPSNVTLKFLRNGSLSINADVVVTISGQIEADLHQIFQGDGTVTFASGTVTEIYPQWWGAKGDGSSDDTAAISAANAVLNNIDGGKMLFPLGVYLFDNLAISGRVKIYEGVSPGTVALTTGVQWKCRSATTNFILLENATGIQLRNIYINGNNYATNTVRLSEYQTDTVFDEITIDGCVNNGVNLNFQSITPDRQVSELKFYGVHTAGRSGGSGITNILIDSDQSMVIGFYNLKSSGDGNDVDYGLRITQGGCALYTSFMTCIKVNDIKLEGGTMVVVDGRSESQADSINVSADTGKVCLINYIHGATTAVTTYTQTSNANTILVGGLYTNIINSSSTGLAMINVGMYTGGVITGTNSWKAAKVDGGKISVPVLATRVVTLTYGATVSIDASHGGIFILPVSNTSAYTIVNPINPAEGQMLTLDIKNNSGGTMGTVTWGAKFKLAGTFTKPANNKRRVISFYYDGTNWIEINRIASDGSL